MGHPVYLNFSYNLLLLKEFLTRLIFTIKENIHENFLDEQMVHVFQDISIYHKLDVLHR